MVERILAPPTPPFLIRPWSANRTEHVATKNPGTDVLKAPGCIVFINARFSTVATEQVLLEGSGGNGPAMQRSTAHAERVADALVWAHAKTVERDGETFYTKLGHGVSPGMGHDDRWAAATSD